MTPCFASQLIRICRRLSAHPTESLALNIRKACLARFLPPLARDLLERLFSDSGIADDTDAELDDPSLSLTVEEDGRGRTQLRIGHVIAPIVPPTNPLLVPQIVFHDNPRQTRILQEMLKDYLLGTHSLPSS